MKENLSIRPATIDDAELLWNWANDSSVREVSINPNPIPWDSHIKWFAERLNSSTTRFYILLEDSIPVGQIRYDMVENKAAEISFSIDGEHRGKGLGKEILRVTRETAWRDLDCESITAFVILGNEASRKAFERTDFTLVGMVEYQGKKGYRFNWKPTKK